MNDSVERVTGWIVTHQPSGRVLHFSTRDGWSLDVVTEESPKPDEEQK